MFKNKLCEFWSEAFARLFELKYGVLFLEV